MAAIHKHNFVVGILTLRNVLAITKPLAVSLQTIDKDLSRCIQEVRLCTSVLEGKRTDTTETMKEIGDDAERLLQENLRMPRTSARQVHRSNIEASSPREYYNRTILIPFLDGIITDLKQRFDPHAETGSKISALVPAFLENYQFEEVIYILITDILVSYMYNQFIIIFCLFI